MFEPPDAHHPVAAPETIAMGGSVTPLRRHPDWIKARLPSGDNYQDLKRLLRAVKAPPGTRVTADAMHCQQESARCVVEQFGGDYLVGLKGN